MKKNLKILVWLTAIAVASALYLAAGSSLRVRMEKELSAAAQRPVTVRRAWILLPPAVRLTGVEVQSPLRIDSLTVRPGVRPRERRFRLSGRLKQSPFSAQGTYLTGGGPIDAQVALTHGDLGDLAPYLRKVLGSAPAKGSMELRSRLTLYQGVLMAHNDVTAAGVVFSGSEPTTLGPDGNRLVELLEDPEGKIRLSFIVAGKPGEEMDWSDLSAGAMREALRQAMSRSILRVMNETEQQKPVEELMRRKLDTLDR